MQSEVKFIAAIERVFNTWKLELSRILTHFSFVCLVSFITQKTFHIFNIRLIMLDIGLYIFKRNQIYINKCILTHFNVFWYIFIFNSLLEWFSIIAYWSHICFLMMNVFRLSYLLAFLSNNSVCCFEAHTLIMYF